MEASVIGGKVDGWENWIDHCPNDNQLQSCAVNIFFRGYFN
jgi:hypothetical protein